MTKPNDKPKHQPPLKNPSDLLNASPPRLPLNTPQPVGSLDKVADRSFAIPVFQSRSKSETRPGCAVPRMARRARSKSTCKGISIMPSTDTPTPCFSPAPQGSLAAALNQRAKEGDISLARRRWQEGTVYVRKSKKLPDAWWGRYVETVENRSGDAPHSAERSPWGCTAIHETACQASTSRVRGQGELLPATGRKDSANG